MLLPHAVAYLVAMKSLPEISYLSIFIGGAYIQPHAALMRRKNIVKDIVKNNC